MVGIYNKNKSILLDNLNQLKSNYKNYHAQYDKLRNEVNLLEENLELVSYGLYKPHYDFETSEDYKRKMNENYEEQKQMIKSDEAAICHTEWHVGNSRVEGRRR